MVKERPAYMINEWDDCDEKNRQPAKSNISNFQKHEHLRVESNREKEWRRQ